MKIRLLFVYTISLLAVGNLLKAQLELPLTFDEAMEFTFTDFGPDLEGGRPADKVTKVVADPDNAENKVAAVIKPAGAQTWSGVTFWDAKKIPVTETDTKISIRVRTPAAGLPLLLKIENNLAGSFFVETAATTTKANEWEVVTFDFSNPTGGELDFNPLQPVYNRMSIFFNFGTGGGASDTTYYMDDVILGLPLINNIPFDFEDTTGTIAYNLGEGGGFGGNVSSIIDNPNPSGINTSGKVVQMVKSGPETWAGTTFTTDGSVNFGGATALTIDVWSPRAGVPILLKMEPSDPAVEVSANTTVANAWETLTFEFGENASGDFATGFSLFPDFGAVGDGSANFTFYIDNIVPAAETVAIPLTFEDDLLYFFTNFDGGGTEVIDNPDKSGINVSDKVARQIRFAGQPWAGSSLLIPGGLDFSESSVFKIKVWSPAAGVPVLLKLEPSDPPIEVIVNTTMANAWEELTFDFTGKTEGEFNKLTWIFNINTMGDGTANSTYYFDDVILFGASGSLTKVALPVTFDPGVNYALGDFGNMAQTVIGDDPVEGASNPVAIATRPDNAETWAGTTIGEPAGFASPFPFSETETQISMRVYSPAAGIPVRLKVENASNNAITAETEATTTMMNAWETLVFDFGQPADGTSAVSVDNTYNKLSIFFHFGTNGATAGAMMFYYDDLLWTGQTNEGLGGPMKIDLPITFSESPEEVDFTLTDFGGAVTILGADPTDATNVVATTQKGASAEVWAGTTMSAPSGLRNPIPLSADMLKMSVRVYSPAANVPVLLKVEDSADAGKFIETLTNTTVADAWETMFFDFGNPGPNDKPFVPGTTYDKISIFFNFLVAGEGIYSWDDVMMVDNTPRSTGEAIGSNTITMTADPSPDVVVGLLVFDDGGNELGKIASIAGRVLTLESPLAVAIAPNARLTFVEDSTPDNTGGQLVNISTRGQVGTADAALFASFVIGKDSQQILINGIGASELTTVSGALVDPIVEVRNAATNELMATNDSWETEQKDLINALWGGPDGNPLKDGSTSCAILITLPQGQWSAILRGVGDTVGVGQVEVYEID